MAALLGHTIFIFDAEFVDGPLNRVIGLISHQTGQFVMVQVKPGREHVF
jgi:hypothetical protein